MSEPLIAAAEEVRRQIQVLAGEILQDGRMAEMRRLLTGLNTLEDLSGQPKTALSSVFNFGEAAATQQETRIEPDEFYGLDALEAAKRYLKKRGKAVPFTEILAAVRSGGCDVGNEAKLRMSLARSTWDIAKVGEDRFGLLEFYPHVKRGGKKKNGAMKDSVEVSLDEARPESEDVSTEEGAANHE